MQNVLQVDVVTLAFLAGSVVPLATSLLAKLSASAQVKSLLNLLLSIATGVTVALVQAGGRLTFYQLAAGAVATYLSSQATYHGIWKPTGAADNLAVNTASFGVGKGQSIPPTGESAHARGAPIGSTEPGLGGVQVPPVLPVPPIPPTGG